MTEKEKGANVPKTENKGTTFFENSQNQDNPYCHITSKFCCSFLSMSIDTIHIEIPKTEIKELVGRKTTINDLGEIEYEYSYKDCIKVIPLRNATKLECSLPKLLKRNNVYCLSHFGITEAIRKMEDILNVSLENGIIRRIDVFVNIDTNHIPKSYYRFFTDLRYFDREIKKKTTLYYTNGNRELYLYDKLIEMEDKETDIPDECICQNLMRIEYRIKNVHIKKLFGKCLHIEDLFLQKTMLILIEDFKKVYFDIYSEKKASINLSNCCSIKDFGNCLMKEGIAALGGINDVLEIIDDLKLRNPKLRKENFSRLKAKTKKVSNMNGFSHEESYVMELDKKFMRGYEEFRASFLGIE